MTEHDKKAEPTSDSPVKSEDPYEGSRMPPGVRGMDYEGGAAAMSPFNQQGPADAAKKAQEPAPEPQGPTTAEIARAAKDIPRSAEPGSCNAGTQDAAFQAFGASDGAVALNRVYNDKHYYLELNGTIVDPTAAQFVNFPEGKEPPLLIGTPSMIKRQLQGLIDEHGLRIHRYDKKDALGNVLESNPIGNADQLYAQMYEGGTVRQYGAAISSRQRRRRREDGTVYKETKYDYDDDKNNALKKEAAEKAKKKAEKAKKKNEKAGKGAAEAAAQEDIYDDVDNAYFDPKKHAAGLGPKPPADNAYFDPSKHAEGLGPKPPGAKEPGKPEVVIVGETRPDPKVASVKAAEDLEVKTSQQSDQLVALDDAIKRAERKLKTAKPGWEKDGLQAQIDRMNAEKDALRDELAATAKDLEALKSPGTSNEDRVAIIKKHNPDAKLHGFDNVEFSGGRGHHHESNVESELNKGKHTVKKKEVTKTPLTKTELEEERTDDGDQVVVDKKQKKTDYRHGRVDTEDVHSVDNGVRQEEHKKGSSHQAGQSEFTDEHTVQQGNQQKKKSKKTAVNYGRDGVGMDHTSSQFEGEVDGDGNPVSGVTKTNSAGGSFKAKDGELTGEGHAKHERANQVNENVQTKAYGGAGFSVSVKVKKVRQKEDKELGRKEEIYYLLVTSVSLNVSAGVAAQADSKRKGSDNKKTNDPANGGASVGAGGKVTVGLSVSQRLDDGGCSEYLSKLEGASAGQSGYGRRELDVISVAATEGADAAYMLYKGAQASMGQADAAKGLKDGESVQLDAGVAVDGNVGANGKKGGASVGGTLKGGVSSNRKVLVTRKGDKIVVTIYIVDGYSYGVEGTASQGPASFTAGMDRERSSGRTVQIELSESDPNFKAKYEALTGVTSPKDLSKAMNDHGFSEDEIKSDSTNEKKKDSAKMGLGIGPASFDIGGGSEWSDEVVIEDGKLKRKIRGANSRKGSVSLDLKKISASGGWLAEQLLGDSKIDYGSEATDALDVTIDDRGVSGNLTGTEQETGNMASDEGKKPKVEGLNIQERHWQNVYRLAQDPKAWADHVGGHESLKDSWKELGIALRKTGGNPELIAVACAKFQSETNHKGKEHLQAAVREFGTASEGGAGRFEVAVPGLQAKLDECVWALPAEYDPAAMMAKLESIQEEVIAAQKANKFSNPSAVADILANIRARKDEVRTGKGSVSKQQAQKNLDDLFDPSKGGLNNPDAPSGMDWLDEVNKNEKVLMGKWRDIEDNCRRMKGAEAQALRELKGMATKGIGSGNAKAWGDKITYLRELHGKWDAELKLGEAEAATLDDADASTLARPNKKMFNYYVNFGSGRTKAKEGEIDQLEEQIEIDEQMKKDAPDYGREAMKKMSQTWVVNDPNDLKAKLARKARPMVASARSAAASAAGRCNYYNLKKKPIPEPGKSIYGKAWACFAKGEEFKRNFESRLVSKGATVTATESSASAAKWNYDEALKLFKEGDAVTPPLMG